MIIETENLSQLNSRLNKISEGLLKKTREIENGILKIVTNGANDIRNTIIKSMQQTKRSQRSYIRGKSKRIKTGIERAYGKSARKARHFSSMPGNPPAVDSGQLVRSIMWNVKNNEVEVGSLGGAPYAKFLESGTKRMAERPFLKPAVDLHIKGIIEKVENYTKKTMTVEGGYK